MLLRRLLSTCGEALQLLDDLGRVLLGGLRVDLVLAHVWDLWRCDDLKLRYSVQVDMIDYTRIDRHSVSLGFLGIARRAVTDTVLYQGQCFHRVNIWWELSLSC